MRRRRARLTDLVVLLAFFGEIGLLSGLAAAEITVGIPVVSPPMNPVGQNTELTVTSRITSGPSDPPVVARSVRLLRLNA